MVYHVRGSSDDSGSRAVEEVIIVSSVSGSLSLLQECPIHKLVDHTGTEGGTAGEIVIIIVAAEVTGPICPSQRSLHPYMELRKQT